MILVTGATGFVGRYLVDHLVKQGEAVIACGRSDKYASFFQDLGVPFVHLDVTSPADIEKLPRKGVDACVHLAALIPAMVTDMTTDAFLKVNTLGTLHVLEHCRKSGVKRFLYSTTLFEGMEHKTQPITETMGRSYALVGGHAAYVISKVAAADYVEHYSQEYGLRGIIFRFTGLLGFGRQEGFLAGGSFHPSAFELFYRAAKAGKPL
jgi:UDP-glucose 4-epimerase